MISAAQRLSTNFTNYFELHELNSEVETARVEDPFLRRGPSHYNENIGYNLKITCSVIKYQIILKLTYHISLTKIVIKYILSFNFNIDLILLSSLRQYYVLRQ
jgi:hypothetical protein